MFFVETSTAPHHNVALPHTFSHTHTHTHTLTHDWPTVADRSSGSGYFSGFAKVFFRPPGGHAIYENIILRELIVSFYLCLYFYAGIMLQRYSIIRI